MTGVETVTLYQGDCREVLATLPECSVDAIVTDPPYELGFMGKAWDGRGVAYSVETWAAALRVLKPGGHLVAFGAPRTYHRLTCAIEDAGFEIRDSLMWLFGSGFPKSLDVSKAMDKAAGAEREIVGNRAGAMSSLGVMQDDGWQPADRLIDTAPASDLARQWQGWGTALKPAYEPIVLARKPLIGTVAANVAAHGTGGLNTDATRISQGASEYADEPNGRDGEPSAERRYGDNGIGFQPTPGPRGGSASGRWPANVALDEEAARLLDAMSGESGSSYRESRNRNHQGGLLAWNAGNGLGFDDRGGVSRFFYTAKASRAEREALLDDFSPARRTDGREKDIENPRLRTNERRNDHPTVKPLDLMRWLCRLVTPPGGLICDPFLGSGSTGMAALDEGFRFIGIDLDEHYIEIARRRINRRHMIEPMPQAEEGQGRIL